MQAYITSIGLISPQNTWENDFSCNRLYENENVLHCIEPEYKKLIPPIQLRRMSRILKLGLAGAQICLNHAVNPAPDAVLVGTGLGCINDLEIFLSAMLEGEDRGLSPIPFINSSHNTVAAQIARMLQNHSYNNTYCHRGNSFESALIDALMLIEEREASQVLLGGIDEFSGHYHTLLKNVNETVVAGEGAGFFLLDDKPGSLGRIRILSAKTFYKPSGDILSGFLSENNLSFNDIDTVLLGINGNKEGDKAYYDCMGRFPTDTQFISYKHLCGEYMTSGSFALALAAHALRNGKFPNSCVVNQGKSFPPKRILIFNHYRQQNYSLIVMSN